MGADHDPLRRALAAWKATEAASEAQEALSPDARAAIVQGAMARRTEPRSLPALFLPGRRLALAGLLPAVLTVATLALVHHNRTLIDPQGIQIAASKQGGRVVFHVEGADEVRVVRSASPNRFEAGSAVRVPSGTFSDAASGGPDLVFYRIEY